MFPLQTKVYACILYSVKPATKSGFRLSDHEHS